TPATLYRRRISRKNGSSALSRGSRPQQSRQAYPSNDSSRAPRSGWAAGPDRIEALPAAIRMQPMQTAAPRPRPLQFRREESSPSQAVPLWQRLEADLGPPQPWPENA